MIKSIDYKQERVILTYKELLGTWEDNIKDFEEGTTVVGIAREVEKSKNGIFVELKPNLVGLAEYKDGIDFDLDEFYELLKNKKYPKTSQVTYGQFKTAFDKS